MGGLTSALALAKAGFQNIEVYEYAADLGFVGAGIQLAPNMARILDRLGVWKDIEKEAVVLNDTSIRRENATILVSAANSLTEGSTDKELAHVDLTYIKPTYTYAHMVGHRHSLANSIYTGCKREKGIKFFFSTKAENIDSFSPKPSFTAIPQNGEVPFKVEADILLAADGIKSRVRAEILRQLGVDARVEDTGQAAYRILLTREQMKNDPELLELLNADRATRWIGERRHIIAYPVSNKTIYNLSTAQPDANFAAAPSATYTTKGSKSAMLSVYSDFCPLVQKMLNLVPEGEVCEWKLRVHEPLPTWIHGSVALVGDACHPTLPHLAQGAAQAIEDAAVIGVVLSHLPDKSPESINKALRVYENVRKERAETLVGLAAASGRAMHLGEGSAKAERDKQFAALKAGKGPVPDKWADADVQKMIYGFDCAKVAEETFDDSFNSM
jgi:salicylate hydroxylase